MRADDPGGDRENQLETFLQMNSYYLRLVSDSLKDRCSCIQHDMSHMWAFCASYRRRHAVQYRTRNNRLMPQGRALHDYDPDYGLPVVHEVCLLENHDRFLVRARKDCTHAMLVLKYHRIFLVLHGVCRMLESRRARPIARSMASLPNRLRFSPCSLELR